MWNSSFLTIVWTLLSTNAYDMDSFRAEVDVATNKIFYTWIVGFEGKVRIIGPEDVKEDYKRMVTNAFEAFR